MAHQRSLTSSDNKAASKPQVLSSRIVHRYSVNGRAGEGIGKVNMTRDSIEVYRLNKILFIFLVGPFLGLIPPIRKMMTNIRIHSFALDQLSAVENTSPRSYESLKMTFTDGSICDFRLSAMGKGRLFEKMKADIDSALEPSSGCKLTETKPNFWEPKPTRP